LAKAIFSIRGLVRGFATLPSWGQSVASVKQAVHDGDTITAAAAGNLSTRFLGIDTPEISFQFPNIGDPRDGTWTSTKNFNGYLTDPFSSSYSDSESYKTTLGNQLESYLQSKFSAQTADNH